jgi:hypothetical protein
VLRRPELKRVPGPVGVACFADKLVKRWKATQLWKQLNAVKQTVMEPKHAGTELERVSASWLICRLLFVRCRRSARCCVSVLVPYMDLRSQAMQQYAQYNGQQRPAEGGNSAWHFLPLTI